MIVLVQFTLLGAVANALALGLPGAMPFLVGNMAAVAAALRFGLPFGLPVAVIATGITGEPLWVLLALLECVLAARFGAQGRRGMALWWRIWLPLAPLAAWITLPPGGDDALQWALAMGVVLLTGATSVAGAGLLRDVTRSGRQMGGLPMATQLSLQLATLMAAPATLAITALLQWNHQQDLQRHAMLLDARAQQLADATTLQLARHRDALVQAAAVLPVAGPEAALAGAAVTGNDFVSLIAIDATGRIVAARQPDGAPPSIGRSVADRDYFRETRASGKPTVSAAFRGRGFGSDLIVAVAVPVAADATTTGMDDAAAAVAMLQGSVPVGSVARPLSVAFDADGLHYAVVDQQAQVVATSLPDQPELVAAGTMGALAEGALARPWWSRLLLSAPSPRFDRGQRFLVLDARSAETGWRAVVLQPLRPLERTQSLLALIAALLVLAILRGLRVLSARFARRHTRGLADIVERLRRLDLDGGRSALEGLGPAPSAELAELVGDFERAEQRLQDMHARLRGSAEALSSLNQALEARVEARTAELRDALANAERLAAAKQGFLANMSHELRTPLAAILGYAELAQRAGAAPAEVRRCLQTVLRQGRHLLAIVNDVLDASKIDAGQLQVQVRPSPPLPPVADAVELLRQRAVEKGLGLLLSTHGELPAEVAVDALRLKQIVLNLVGNAIKFTAAGFVAVRVGASRDAGRWWVEVEDTGVGMDDEQRQRVFQRFEQADESTTRRFGGTGLGLYISRQLAQQMGGDIEVDGAPGVGSRFTLRLPVGAETAWALATPTVIADDTPAAATPPPRLRGRVLVADDVADLRALLRLRIEATGASVIEAADGAAAVAAAGAGAPDLVLMDMHMPVMDGLEAVQRLRAAGFTRPVVACSADVMPANVAAFIDAGCDDALGKPIDDNALHALLVRHLAAAAPAATAVDDDPMARVMHQVRARFAASVQAEREALAAARALADRAALRERAHRLKGSAGTFGFPHVSSAAAAVENALRDGTDDLAAAALDAL
ncbi:MAG TPA: hypothetical protein DCM32_01750, partial [Xanthomonadaceae bacterium]|nr:hypothetical protein [Xanthomonadaceae bacterium]